MSAPPARAEHPSHFAATDPDRAAVIVELTA
jgi:hypothetical protein